MHLPPTVKAGLAIVVSAGILVTAPSASAARPPVHNPAAAPVSVAHAFGGYCDNYHEWDAGGDGVPDTWEDRCHGYFGSLQMSTTCLAPGGGAYRKFSTGTRLGPPGEWAVSDGCYYDSDRLVGHDVWEE